MADSLQSWLRHGAIYGLASAVNKAGSLLLLPLYAKSLSRAEFGILDLITISITLGVLLAQFGIGSAIMRTVALSGFAAREIISTSFRLMLGSGIITGCLLFFSSNGIAGLLLGSASYGILIQISAAILLLNLLSAVVTAELRVSEKSTRFAVWQLSGFAVEVIAALIFLLVFRLGLAGILLAMLLKALMLAASGSLMIAHQLRGRFSKRVMQALLKFGLPLVPAAFGLFMLNQSDRYFLRLWRTMDELGTYAVGYKLGLGVALLVNALQMAWPPIMYKLAKQPAAEKEFARFTVVNLSLFTTAGAFLSLFAPELLRLLAGEKFVEAAVVVPLVAMAYVFQGLYYMLNIGLNVLARTRYEPLLISGGVLLNLLGNLLLIPRYGMLGAAVATVAGYGGIAFLADRNSQRLFPIPQDYRKIAALLGAFLLVALCCYTLPAPFSPQLVLSKALIMACFVFFVSRVGRFSVIRAVRKLLLPQQMSP